MKRPILSLCALGLAIACGSSFAGGGDTAAGGGGSGGGGGGGGSAGKASGGGRGGSAGSSNGGTGDATGIGGGGVEPPIGSAGETVIGIGGDTVIGVGGDGTVGVGGGMVGGGGAPSRSCDELIADYLSELDKARDCNPDAGEPECNHDWVKPGPCGCLVAYSGFAENLEQVDDLYAQIEAQGCEFATCEIPCIDPLGSCLVSGNDRFICQ